MMLVAPKWHDAVQVANAVSKAAGAMPVPTVFFTSELPAEYEAGGIPIAYGHFALGRLLGCNGDAVVINDAWGGGSSHLAGLVLHEFAHAFVTERRATAKDAEDLRKFLRFEQAKATIASVADIKAAVRDPSIRLRRASPPTQPLARRSLHEMAKLNIDPQSNQHGSQFIRAATHLAYHLARLYPSLSASELRFAAGLPLQRYATALADEIAQPGSLRQKLSRTAPWEFLDLVGRDQTRFRRAKAELSWR